MTHSKMTHSIMKWTVAAALAPALVTAALLAQTSPHYVNARKFLKTAQVLIRIPPQPNVQLTLKPADDAVQAAIGELDRGAHTGPQDGAEQLGAGQARWKRGIASAASSIFCIPPATRSIKRPAMRTGARPP